MYILVVDKVEFEGADTDSAEDSHYPDVSCKRRSPATNQDWINDRREA